MVVAGDYLKEVSRVLGAKEFGPLLYGFQERLQGCLFRLFGKWLNYGAIFLLLEFKQSIVWVVVVTRDINHWSNTGISKGHYLWSASVVKQNKPFPTWWQHHSNAIWLCNGSCCEPSLSFYTSMSPSLFLPWGLHIKSKVDRLWPPLSGKMGITVFLHWKLEGIQCKETLPDAADTSSFLLLTFAGNWMKPGFQKCEHLQRYTYLCEQTFMNINNNRLRLRLSDSYLREILHISTLPSNLTWPV